MIIFVKIDFFQNLWLEVILKLLAKHCYSAVWSIILCSKQRIGHLFLSKSFISLYFAKLYSGYIDLKVSRQKFPKLLCWIYHFLNELYLKVGWKNEIKKKITSSLNLVIFNTVIIATLPNFMGIWDSCTAKLVYTSILFFIFMCLKCSYICYSFRNYWIPCISEILLQWEIAVTSDF